MSARPSGLRPPLARPSAGLAIAAVAYLCFLATSIYAVGFLAERGVPHDVDHGGPRGRAPVAVPVDLTLLALFAVQHSLMARASVKRWLRRAIPPHLERATYVLASSAALGLTFWLWRPLDRVVWELHDTRLRAVVWTFYGLGWATVVAMTFAIDHAELVGLRQVADHARRRPPMQPRLQLPLPYRWVRHPMMTGFAVAFVATPTMTVGHLLFAVAAVAYILVGVRLEERDLRASLPLYGDYAARTPRFVPSPHRRA